MNLQLKKFKPEKMSDDRVCVFIGKRNTGKSTLVKTIARAIKALSGEFREGKGLSIGYFAQQELDVLNVDDTPLGHLVRLSARLGINAREQ